MKVSKLAPVILMMVLSLFNNCSDVSFKESSSESNGQLAIEPTDPNPTPTPPTNPPTPTPPQIVPKVSFVGPPCQRLSLCEAEFKLDKAYSLKTEFDWRTNDTLYQTPHTPVYAQPNVHYTPTAGHLVFQPGETSKKIYIQNINGYTLEVIIGVIMSQCKYGTYTGTCASFFQQ